MTGTAWIEILGGIAAQVLVAAWYFGRLAERVRNQGGWIQAMSEKLDKHETRIAKLEGRDGAKHR